MSNQLENKRRTLAQMLANSRLTKIGADQEISHTEPEKQDDLGAEQQQEIKDNVEGVLASTEAAANNDTKKVQEVPNCQSLNTTSEAALASTGTEVHTMDQEGDRATFPKSASAYRTKLAGILSRMSKKASAEPEVTTATEVLTKFASLTKQASEQELNDAKQSLLKLASTNPLFGVCRDHILMRKLAEDVEALAEAEGVSPEEAADALDAAAAQDPSIMEEANDEADGEAVAELASAEGAADEMMQGAQQLADNASSFLGEEVTADDILDAIDEVEAQAEAMGVPPEALIEQAMQELQGGDEDVSAEDEANADAILEEAAANGISPEEVIQMAADQLGGEEAPAEEPPAEETKQASVRQARTPRAAYVQHLLHR